MALFRGNPLLDETEQTAREERTEQARRRSVETLHKADALQANADAQATRVHDMRQSFERANRRLAGR